MTKLALIGPGTYTEDANSINDVVGAFPDDWNFTPKEQALFNIVESAESIEEIDAKKPKLKKVFKSKTTEWTENPPEEKEVWEADDKKYYEVQKRPKYELYLDVESATIKKSHGKYPENLETIVDVI